MFAIIYRGFVYPDYEDEYLKHWNKIAKYFVESCGALGSCLHKTADNEYIAYSRWPDRQTRDASWGPDPLVLALPNEIQTSIQQLKKCIDRSKPYDEICMDVVDDLLIAS